MIDNVQIRDLYLKIIQIGILNIRVLSSNGNADQAWVEAMHIHNIPLMLMAVEQSGLERGYWEIAVDNYLREADPKISGGFQEVWHALSGRRKWVLEQPKPKN